MQLETVYKIIKENQNCLGYVKAEKLLKAIQENLRNYELIITVMRTSDKEVNTSSIIKDILLPVCKAKQVLTRLCNEEIHIFTKRITKLHILNQIFYKLNHTIGKKEGFEIISNYDMLREDIRNKEIN